MASTPATPKRNKWVSSALSAALRNTHHGLSQELREIIADRLDNQVVEVNNMHNVIQRCHDAAANHRLTVKLAIEHLRKNRPTCALSKLRGTCEDAEDMMIEMAQNP